MWSFPKSKAVKRSVISLFYYVELLIKSFLIVSGYRSILDRENTDVLQHKMFVLRCTEFIVNQSVIL